MSIMAGARMKNPEAGFAPDFVMTLERLLKPISEQGIKVVSNAGGVNVRGCVAALQAAIDKAGINLKVAAVEGDNLIKRQQEFFAAGVVEMFSGEEFPEQCLSINSYLGASAVRDALNDGADIVITGRVVDSAVVLGPLMHEFDWTETDYDQLAQGSLAGHVIECGAQCTGGNFTDWQLVEAGYANMGFPIVECVADGSFVVSKPEGTGGLVSVGTVGEQILYEIGDPSQYLLPDVTCDFTGVQLEQLDDDHVLVSGAKGRAPSDHYKVSATYMDGFRCNASFMIGGRQAVEKGQRVAESIISRVSFIFQAMGLEKFTASDIEVLGSETTYGEHSRALANREVVVKIAVHHQDKKALGIFAREIAQAATAMAPGLTGLVGGRPKPSPMIRLFSFLWPKDQIDVSYTLADASKQVTIGQGECLGGGVQSSTALVTTDTNVAVAECDSTTALINLAMARSGDKGDHCNVGILARDPAYLPYIQNAVQPEKIRQYLSHVMGVHSDVKLYALPGLDAFNLMLEQALGGGGIASLRIDPQGKAMAQQLLDMPISLPAEMARQAEENYKVLILPINTKQENGALA
jgi:Acyclic terpene utilisation family protein AtuA